MHEPCLENRRHLRKFALEGVNREIRRAAHDDGNSAIVPDWACLNPLVERKAWR